MHAWLMRQGIANLADASACTRRRWQRECGRAPLAQDAAGEAAQSAVKQHAALFDRNDRHSADSDLVM
jgi:hypothetical protein